MAAPFSYPVDPHTRKHGPQGYAEYGSYRPWLRDEFSFRCVYCLTREQWGLTKGVFDLDHFTPLAHDLQQREHYDNLLYACRTCNGAKADQTAPDPAQALTAGQIVVQPDGSIEVLTPEAERLVWLLDLDGDDYRHWRLVWMRIIELAERFDRDLYLLLMGFPNDLPNLRRLVPPGGNSRPDGIENCFYERRQRGELPDEY